VVETWWLVQSSSGESEPSFLACGLAAVCLGFIAGFDVNDQPVLRSSSTRLPCRLIRDLGRRARRCAGAGLSGEPAAGGYDKHDPPVTTGTTRRSLALVVGQPFRWGSSS
jgi:hypothetical protein